MDIITVFETVGGGSIPSWPANGGYSSVGRTADCDSVCHGFDSH